MKLITGKIDVKKIDKARLFEGKKGTYLDIVLIPVPNSEYSDYMIVQKTSKDEDSIILGNASILSRTSTTEPENDTEPDVLGDETSDDLPF